MPQFYLGGKRLGILAVLYFSYLASRHKLFPVGIHLEDNVFVWPNKTSYAFKISAKPNKMCMVRSNLYTTSVVKYVLMKQDNVYEVRLIDKPNYNIILQKSSINI